MTPKNPWQSYRKVATQTASPVHLVLMLYDGAIRFMERSLTGFDQPDLLERNQTINNNIIRAQAIIRELDIHLDMERGGEVALNFHRLYDYHYRRLGEGNLSKTREPIVEVIGLIRVLRDSWFEMIQRGAENPPENLTPPPKPRKLETA